MLEALKQKGYARKLAAPGQRQKELTLQMLSHDIYEAVNQHGGVLQHAAPVHEAERAPGSPLKATKQKGYADAHAEFLLGAGEHRAVKHVAPLQEAECEIMLKALKHITVDSVKRTVASRRRYRRQQLAIAVVMTAG